MKLFTKKKGCEDVITDVDELAAEKIVNRASKRVGFDRKPLHTKAKVFFVCTFATFMLTVAFAVIGVFAVAWIGFNGPSPRVRELLVASLKETSAAGFVANIFVPDIEIDYIVNGDGDISVDEDTNTDLIQIPMDKNDKPEEDDEVQSKPIDNNQVAEGNDDIIIEDVVGATYRGKVIIVKDPSRVMLGVCGAYGEGQQGATLSKIVDKYGGVLGVNASGFSDEGGQGSGAIPVGIVISEGQLLWGDLNTAYDVIGFDNNNILIIDRMTAAEALAMGIRDAMSFGPFLVKNGNAVNHGGGVNPRTAIGQRADGAVIFAVIEGRQISSMGATLRDLSNLMLDYGAINAANLDGGSSSALYGDGEYLIEGSYIFGMRKLPNAFIVK